jgi:dethiobiotin synthetase
MLQRLTIPGLFVTGTDTGVGKTVIAVALLRTLVASGQRAAGMKPVSAGFEAGGSVNADVAAMMGAGNVDVPLADRNPYAFVPAIAPHLAAAEAGVGIDLDVIEAAYNRVAARSDVVVVEGAGGVAVPLDARHDMLDIAQRLRLPVLLVVGVRLGCLNHALLSAAAISARGLQLSGWVANCIDPEMRAVAANIDDLGLRLSAPLVAQVAFGAPPFQSKGVLAKLGLD